MKEKVRCEKAKGNKTLGKGQYGGGNHLDIKKHLKRERGGKKERHAGGCMCKGKLPLPWAPPPWGGVARRKNSSRQCDRTNRGRNPTITQLGKIGGR